MASKHMVICEECGRRFNAGYGSYYNKKSRRYTCPSCVKAHNANVREAKTGMRQSKGAMIAKIIIGALFIAVGFSSPDSGWTVGYFLTALVIGGSLIAWGLVPYFKAKKMEKEAEEEAREYVEQVRQDIENTVSICPYCGARTKGSVCEYCGSPLE